MAPCEETSLVWKWCVKLWGQLLPLLLLYFHSIPFPLPPSLPLPSLLSLLFPLLSLCPSWLLSLRPSHSSPSLLSFFLCASGSTEWYSTGLLVNFEEGQHRCDSLVAVTVGCGDVQHISCHRLRPEAAVHRWGGDSGRDHCRVDPHSSKTQG